jgi:hypothetical protein
LSARCSAIKASGERCKVSVEPPATLCWAHDPANRETRRRITSKAGKSRGPSRELATIKQRLSDLADDVLADKVNRASAAVAGQILNTYIRAVSVELKAREQMELIERLESLEETLEQRKGNRYGQLR